MKFKYNDGGRAAAGYKGDTRDCVTRSIAIASGKSYTEVYEALQRIMKTDKRHSGNTSPRNGVLRKHYEKYLRSIGFEFVACMGIGSGCRVHVREDELPSGSIILRLSRHLLSLIHI